MLRRLVLGALTAVWLYGFLTARPWEQDIWSPEGRVRFLIFWALWAVTATVVRFTRPAWLTAVAVVAGASFIIASPGASDGVPTGAPLLAAALLFLASATLGRRLFPHLPAPLALLCGLAVYLAVVFGLVHFPVNYPALYWLLLALPPALFPKTALALLCDLARWRPAGPFPLQALIAGLLLAHAVLTVKPESSADGLAMHLAVPAAVAFEHRWHFDVLRSIWAVMPLGGDWGYTLAYLTGGELAARLVNFGLLLTLAALLAHGLRRVLSPAPALLLLALFLSTPLTHLVTASLFIENFWAAFLLGGCLLVLEDDRSRFAIPLLFGAAVMTKYGALAFVLPAAGVLAARAVRRRDTSAWSVLGLFLVLASATYWNAWFRTGNPIFPFGNAVFRSPWFDPVSFTDERFREPLSWRTLYDLTFSSHRFYEGQNGGFGFAWFWLLPSGLLALRRDNRLLAGLAFTFAIVTFAAQPNLRYLYPALPMLLLSSAPLFDSEADAWLARAAWGLGLVSILLGLAFFASPSWYHKEFVWSPWDHAALDEYRTRSAPGRILTGWLNRHHPGEAALFLETLQVAGLEAPVYSNAWHHWAFQKRLRAVNDPREARALFLEYGIRWFIAPASRPVTEVPVDRFLRVCTQPEQTAGLWTLRRLQGRCEALDPQPLPPGLWDDADLNIVCDATWLRDVRFPQTHGATVIYSATPRHACEFRFEGREVDWIFTRAPNRGRARVTVDGASPAVVDLYSPEVRWQSRHTFRAWAPGVHALRIEILPDKDPRSTDYYVDLDAVAVR